MPYKGQLVRGVTAETASGLPDFGAGQADEIAQHRQTVPVGGACVKKTGPALMSEQPKT